MRLPVAAATLSASAMAEAAPAKSPTHAAEIANAMRRSGSCASAPASRMSRTCRSLSARQPSTSHDAAVAAAAAFLQRSVALTVDPRRRAERALAAAEVSFQAGAFDAALGLLATAAAAGPLDDFQRARVDLLRGHIAFASGSGSDAPLLLLKAAKRLEAVDPKVARETYLIAWRAANLAGQGDVALEICRAIRALPQAPGSPRPLDTLLDAVAMLTIDGRAAATPVLQRAVKALAEIPVEDVIRWGSPAAATAASWDVEGWRALNERRQRPGAASRHTPCFGSGPSKDGRPRPQR
jgi:predicted negative regulator of RcsB-dependent stress response